MGYEYYMNDPRFWRGVIEGLDASWEATKKRFAKYNKLNEDIMKEKKTKKMTKAEAFEYLKGKKIKCICAVAHEDAQANKVEKFLKDVGCKYHFANHISWCDWYWPLYGFIVDKKGEIYVAFENQKDFFEHDFSELISADDILSIEIVDEKKPSQEFVPYELTEMGKVQSTLDDGEVLIITRKQILKIQL